MGFAWSSTFVALNHYFSKKRGQAIGLSMVGTALGMMAMPQLVQLLLVEFNFKGAVLILGGIACHSLAGSMLLQPIKWHLRPEKPKKEEEMMDLSEKVGIYCSYYNLQFRSVDQILKYQWQSEG